MAPRERHRRARFRKPGAPASHLTDTRQLIRATYLHFQKAGTCAREEINLDG